MGFRAIAYHYAIPFQEFCCEGEQRAALEVTGETGRFCLYFEFLLWEKFQPLVLLVRKA